MHLDACHDSTEPKPPASAEPGKQNANGSTHGGPVRNLFRSCAAVAAVRKCAKDGHAVTEIDIAARPVSWMAGIWSQKIANATGLARRSASLRPFIFISHA